MTDNTKTVRIVGNPPLRATDAPAVWPFPMRDQDKPKNQSKPRAVIMGEIEVVELDGENFKTQLGLLIVFNSPEELRSALNSGVCEFSVLDEKVAA